MTCFSQEWKWTFLFRYKWSRTMAPIGWISSVGSVCRLDPTQYHSMDLVQHIGLILCVRIQFCGHVLWPTELPWVQKFGIWGAEIDADTILPLPNYLIFQVVLIWMGHIHLKKKNAYILDRSVVPQVHTGREM